MKTHRIRIGLLACLALVFGLVSPVSAATLSVKFKNQTAQSISAINITPKSGGPAQGILSSAIAAGATQAVQFTPAASDCVFVLSYVTGAGQTTSVPDTDLCQTEQVILQ